MPELDRVIYDIERCIYPDPQTCWDCSKYKKGMPLPDCVNELLADVLELLKAQPKWIPVKERLPDKEESWFNPKGMYIRNQSGGFDRFPEWRTTDCYEDESLYHVTHWMPMPKPPEENKHDE